MTNVGEIYKCNHCGIIALVLHEGKGKLICCGEPMELMTENTVEAAVEKHVPVVEKTADGVKVTVGSVDHPMVEKHYIEWIQVLAGNQCLTQMLKPGEEPVAEFKVKGDVTKVTAYCNLHGLWRSE